MLSKFMCRGAATAAVGLLALSGALAPAEAGSGPYNIKGGALAFTSATKTAFEKSGCSNLTLNGVDAQVVDISGYAGRPAIIDWRATAVPFAGFGATSSLQVFFFSASCAPVGLGVNAPRPTPGAYAVSVPGDARWIVVTPMFLADVTFSIL